MPTKVSATEGHGELLELEYPLTPEQVTSLHRDSWAFLPGLLDRATAEEIRGILASAKVRDKGNFLDLEEAEGPASDAEAQPLSNRDIFSHEGNANANPSLLHIAVSKRLSGAIVGLMRQDSAVFTQDVSFIKPPGAAEVHLHQDHSYFPFDRQGCLTLWIALVDLPGDSGPLHYLEGSHLAGPLGFKDQADVRDVYPHLRDRRVVGGHALRAGDAQVHWDLTLHGSRSNTSDVTREAMAFRYVRSDTVYTGLSHAHYDRLNLNVGERFGNMSQFWRISRDGLIDAR